MSTDILWLADYFGCTHGSEGIKNKINHDFKNGSILNVPVLDSSKWVFECEVITAYLQIDKQTFYSIIFIIKI